MVKVAPRPTPPLATLHAAAVQFREVFHDGQSQPEASVPARGGGVRLAKAIEDLAEELRRNPLAAIGHRDVDMGIAALNDDVNPAALGREFHGIDQQVPKDLLEPVFVAHHDAVDAGEGRGEPDFFPLAAGRTVSMLAFTISARSTG